MDYKQNFVVKYSDMNHDLGLKPYALLNFLQDIASENAEELGFGYTFMSQNNLAWFLIKYRMEFENYPIGVYDLTIKTEPRGYNKLFAYRGFELYDKEVLLGKVFSVWSVVDINTRMTVPVANVITDNPKMVAYEKREDDLAFSKIRPSATPTISKEFEVRYNDLDVNGHANNGNYIIWALEPLDFGFKSEHKLKTLDLMFKKEAKYGEKVIVEVEYKDELTTVHRIKNTNDEDLCLVECCWVG